jgi:excinuclease UvrABC nuclease subunit
MQRIKNKIKKLPDSPGVYFFMKGKKILYIGKATSLRDRVRSYFSGDIESTRGPLISKMLSQFNDIAFQKTDSVLEALILEAYLIKKHQPEANILEKDDRSFNYVIITKEDFPRVLIVRQRELEGFLRGGLRKFSSRPPLGEIAYSFGPFTNGAQLKQAMKIVRRLFPFRDKCNPNQDHPCFNNQIGLCPGVCTGEISERDYGKQVKNIALFFEGNKTKLINSLKREMKTFAKKREFEEANKIKRQIFALYHIQDISLIKASQVSKAPFDTKTFRIESYDIAHLSGTNVVGAMTVVEDGEIKKSDYRKFKIKNDPGVNDTKALSEILARRLNHPEWPLPNLIVIDGGIAQKKTAEKVLKEKKINIPVVSVVKDERHKPKEILGMNDKLRIMNYGKKGKDIKKYEDLEEKILLANAEAHCFAIGFHKQLRRKLF